MPNAAIAWGLSSAEAARRLKMFGPNELPSPERRDFAHIVLGVVRQPMFALLLGGAILYVFLGEPLDAGVLLLFATLSVSIGIIQEARSEKVLEALRNLASPRALVVRDGEMRRLAGRELVPDDIVILSEGDRIPADAILLEEHDLLADESLLTGESVPVRKLATAAAMAPANPGGEDLPWVFAGTLVARGSGTARVTATGLLSEMGKIGKVLHGIAMEQPGLNAQLRWLVRDFALAGLAVAGLVVLFSGLMSGHWLQAGLGGIAIGMSVLPEEIPLVLAVFMSMGAWRISRAGVLTRRAAAIETLGSATILCTDKTGTLTENRMRIVLLAAEGALWLAAGDARPSQRADEILAAALGASAPIPTDPMDRAVHDAALPRGLVRAGRLLKQFGLRPDLFAVTNVWGEVGGGLVAFAKGAPEAVAGLCRLPEAAHARIIAETDRFARDGIRVLAVARARLAGGALPQSPRDIAFLYAGLVGFADPLRPGIGAALRECKSAGIRVVMITGDYPATARAIAGQAGIDNARVLSGDDVSALGAADLALAVRTTSIFARIRPEQKLRLVEAFKRDREIVAMTGDGVNDAPAIKAAHIGIAMGGRGTDVAREASALVLLNDDFTSIVAAVRLGRRVYDNLRKAIEYIIAVHIPIAGLALLPFLFGLPLMLMPIQIALLEMVIDPACSVVFESEREEKDVMLRPPRRPGTALLTRQAMAWALVQGFLALGAVAALLLGGNRLGLGADALRTTVFTGLVLTNIGLIVVNRSFQASIVDALGPNPAFWGLTAIVVVVMGTGIFWPPARALFHFGAVRPEYLVAAIITAVGVTGVLETIKRTWFGRPGKIA